MNVSLSSLLLAGIEKMCVNHLFTDVYNLDYDYTKCKPQDIFFEARFQFITFSKF